jgi:hypothetical protein
MTGNQQYRKAYEAAASELEEILIGQEKAEQRILALRKTMNALATLCEQEGINTSDLDAKYAWLTRMVRGSLTEDILKIINATRVPLTTGDIRAELNKLGGSLAEQSNPLATINAVASRLADAGQVKETVKDGRKAWRALNTVELVTAPPRRKYGATSSLANTLLAQMETEQAIAPPETHMEKKKK